MRERNGESERKNWGSEDISREKVRKEKKRGMEEAHAREKRRKKRGF